MKKEDRLLLRSPDSCLAATPHLLGFTPQDSVVVLGLATDSAGTRRLVLTQRLDRPSSHGLDSEQSAQVARDSARVMVEEAGADTVIVSVWGSESPSPTGALPELTFVDQLVDALDDRGAGTLDVLYTDGQRRWSYGCDDHGCCPPEGALIPQETRTLMAAEFAYAGQAVASSRQSITDELEPVPDPAVVQAIADRQATTPIAVASRDTIRDARVDAISDLHMRDAQHVPLDADQIAETALALADIRIRDTYVWDLGQPYADRHAAIASLAQVVRAAPPGHVAPAATVLALQHYQVGDGARANVALDRAAADDPDYSLARLVRMSLTAGLPPATFAQAMAGLSRETCLDPDRPAPAATTASPAPQITTPPQGLAL